MGSGTGAEFFIQPVGADGPKRWQHDDTAGDGKMGPTTGTTQ